MAAPTNLAPVGFPAVVTLPKGGGPSASFTAGAAFDITKLNVEMSMSLPAGSNVTFGDGSKQLPFVQETFTSIGRKQMTRPVRLLAPATQPPDSPVTVTVLVKYVGDPQIAPVGQGLAVVRAAALGMAGAAKIVAGAAAATATAVVLRRVAARRRSSGKKASAKKAAAKKKLSAKKAASRASSAKKSSPRKTSARKSTARRGK